MDTKNERLERVAEELMGRRKWKQYQESLTQAHTNDLIEKQSPSIEQEEETSNNKQQQQQNSENNKTGIKTETLDIKEENKLMTTEDVSEKLESDYCKTTSTAADASNETEAIDCKATFKLKRPEPVDWKPDDKCNFCVNGKLLKVNEIGELVVETGPVHSESELNKHIIESDDSSSSSDTLQKNSNNIPSSHHHQQQQQQSQLQFPSSLIQKNLETLFKTVGLNPNMTSLESMAAQLAAFQRLQTPEINQLNQLNPFYPNLFYPFQQQQQQQISPTTTPDRSVSPSVATPSNDESPTDGHASGEQPLDLSAKPSGSSTPIDSKNVFKAKPRISTVPGRRSYTEEELNNALQAILSGKLGTRRAAVLYGIPRSTLRNKVYKLAIEQKRELLANHPPIAILEEEDEKDSGGEEEKEQPKIDDSNEQLQNYLKLLEKSSESMKQEQQQKDARAQSSSWPIDPTAWIQSLILANGFQGIGGFSSLLGNPQSTSSSSPKQEELPEFLRKLLTQPQDVKQEFNNKLNCATKSEIDPLMMMNLLQQNKKTPELDLNEGSDDSNTILKIPSIPKAMFGQQPVLTATATQSKNGDIAHHSASNTPSTSPQMAVSPRLQISSTLANHLTMRSPSSLVCQRSESESPEPRAQFNLHAIIRDSINKNFQTNRNLDDPKHSTPLTIDPMNDYQKRPTISVIKNLGGTDISRFGTNPNITQLQQQQLSPNNTGTGGKGTRPKRGKYRNYDRDSLVEAVKAVQRGEMSVHRAGSYYGVPHSTLEYKVKERHLMRPRKREPKPQPLDGTSSTSSSSVASNVKRQEVQVVDKTKPLSMVKSPMKSPFASPNGLKIPPFIDHAQMAAQLQLQSQLLWPHPSSFPGFDFTRSSSQNNAPSFSPNAAENFLAQQMLQKFQEEQQQQQQQQQFKPPVNGGVGQSGGNSSSSKRDIDNVASFYDPVSTNGSFLDGIIRSSLDKKSGEINHGALFEHLLKKNSLPTSSSSGPSDSGDEFKAGNKRPSSPINFTHNIKRERASPPSNQTNDLGFAMHDEQRQSSALAKSLTIKEELNGSLNNNDDTHS